MSKEKLAYLSCEFTEWSHCETHLLMSGWEMLLRGPGCLSSQTTEQGAHPQPLCVALCSCTGLGPGLCLRHRTPSILSYPSAWWLSPL